MQLNDIIANKGLSVDDTDDSTDTDMICDALDYIGRECGDRYAAQEALCQIYDNDLCGPEEAIIQVASEFIYRESNGKYTVDYRNDDQWDESAEIIVVLAS